MSDATIHGSGRRRAAWAALMRKEWCEQRWRFFLGTVVLSGLLAGLLRAQVVPSITAAALIYGPVGLLLVIFLAAGPVAAERADRTWEFLMAQPVSRSDVLLAKWAVGVFQLVGTMVMTTVAGLLALWSRGFRIMPTFDYSPETTREAFSMWCLTHPALSLCVFATVATIAMACWFTPLCLLLTRARNEFAAALGGLLLTIALLLWLLQLGFLEMSRWPGLSLVFKGAANVLGGVSLLNPLFPLVLIFVPERYFEYFMWLLVVWSVHVAVWIVLPLWCVRHSSNRLIEKWMGA